MLGIASIGRLQQQLDIAQNVHLTFELVCRLQQQSALLFEHQY